MSKISTDIEQSMKLAKILPIESADMYYPNRTDIKYNCPIPLEIKHGNPLLSQEIPAWSLDVLINILPYPHIHKNYNGKWVCECEIADTTYLWEDNTLADACVSMILKLKEKNLL